MSHELSLPVLTGNANLAQYIHAVNSIPLLTEKEEHELAVRLHDHGDLEAAKKLVLSHLRLVVSIARDYNGYGLNQADLIQEGNIGLMKAAKRFDPDRGVRLVSFAIHWIKAEIHEFILRNWSLVRIATTKPQRKLFFNLRSMKKSLAALNPTEAQTIADDLGVKLKDVYAMEQRLSGRDVALIADNSDDDDDHHFAPIDWLVDDKNNEPDIQLQKKDEHHLETVSLNSAIDQLDSRSQDIVKSRWLSDNNATLHELADKYGVSPERIRQIEAKAMEKMRYYLNDKT